MLTSPIVIVGLLNILVIGLFYVFIFKRKVTLTSYADKVVFNSNLILMLISLHYLSAILLYAAESIFNSLPFQPALLLPDLGALLFWTLLIYVVKKILLRRAFVKNNPDSPVAIRNDTTNFKVITIALLPVIAIAIYFSYPSISTKFTGNIRSKFTCGEQYLLDEFVVNVERNEVVRIRKAFDEKNVLFHSDITKLDDCVIVNSKNWTCGGKYNFGGKDATYQSIDGKFGYIARSSDKPNSCKTEQLN